MRDIFKKRIARVRRAMQPGSLDSALLLCSAKQSHVSRDTELPFRQDSDFFYLTGSQIKHAALLIFSSRAKPILFAKKVDARTELWEGKQPDPSKLARLLGAELVLVDQLEGAVRSALKKIDRLYYQSTPTLSLQIAREMLSSASHLRSELPQIFCHSDLLLEPLRLYKEPEEVKCIEVAARATNNALFNTLPLLQPDIMEYQIAANIEYWFKLQDCGVAFPSIAAAGRSAATLHYQDHSQALRSSEMLLIDCGATYKGYAADITRVLPVSGRFDKQQARIYDAVLAAQLAAIAKIKHGVRILDVYNAAAKELCYVLRDLKIIKGKNISKPLKDKAFAPWFPHGIGHSLGLDTHDIGKLRGNNDARLKAGMVFTVEPGLYFPKKIAGVAACGVRIEDDILVTKTGCRVLSAGFPKERQEIESLWE